MLATFEELGNCQFCRRLGDEYCFGFLCLGNRSIVVLCYNGLLPFYFIHIFKILP